jgi:hypothetical protein
VSKQVSKALPTDENSEIADFEAKVLDINDCEFAMYSKREMEIKKLEYAYFENVTLDQHKMFGGTMG